MSWSGGCNACGRVVGPGHECYTSVTTSWVSVYRRMPENSGMYKVLINNNNTTKSIFDIKSGKWDRPDFKNDGFGKDHIVDWWEANE